MKDNGTVQNLNKISIHPSIQNVICNKNVDKKKKKAKSFFFFK